jgi:hypothetical protein
MIKPLTHCKEQEFKELVEKAHSGKSSNSDLHKLEGVLKNIISGKNGVLAWLKKEDPTIKFNESIFEELLKGKSLDDGIDLYLEQLSDDFVGQQLNKYLDIHLTLKKYALSELACNSEVCDVIVNLLSTNNEQSRTVLPLLGAVIEKSLSQSRKSSVGVFSEQIIHTILDNWNISFGAQYTSEQESKGAATDFIVPNVSAQHRARIKAYIAVQSSTNDRIRMSTSEMHGGAKNYLCSFNGCVAMTKTTKDISNDLIKHYKDENVIYVVIEKEKNREIKRVTEEIVKRKQQLTKLEIEKQELINPVQSPLFDDFLADSDVIDKLNDKINKIELLLEDYCIREEWLKFNVINFDSFFEDMKTASDTSRK